MSKALEFINTVEDTSKYTYRLSHERLVERDLFYPYPHRRDTLTITLDTEDIQYFYNKYKGQSEKEAIKDKELKTENKQKEILSKISELNKLKEELNDLHNRQD